MGLWSKPIVVNPPNLQINCKIIPDKIIGQLEHCGYFENIEETNMDNLHQQCNDTAKIWGYFSKEEKEAWKDLCFIICQQNGIDCVQLHFHCEENEFPYIIEMKQNVFTIYQGRIGHIYYSDIYMVKKNEKEDGMDDMCVKFNMEKYKKNIKISGFMEAFFNPDKNRFW